jgi:hypothetical protein
MTTLTTTAPPPTTTPTTRPLRPADRAHRLALLNHERAALRGLLAVAYDLDDTAEVDRISDALGGLVAEHDALVMAG